MTWPKPYREADSGIFNSRVYLYNNREKHKKAVEFLGQKEHTPGVGVTQAFQNEIDGAHVVVIGWFDEDIGTFIHELSHATFFILDGAGVKIAPDNHEVFCYLQDYLFEKLWTAPNSKTKTAKTSQLDSSKNGLDLTLSLSPSTLSLK